MVTITLLVRKVGMLPVNHVESDNPPVVSVWVGVSECVARETRKRFASGSVSDDG